MKITIKHKKSGFQKGISKVTVLQDEVEIPLTGYYYLVEGIYYYYVNLDQVSAIASNEAEFKQYLRDEVLPSRLSKLLS